VLEDLRLLTNYQMDSENRLCLLLLGLTELPRRLSMAEALRCCGGPAAQASPRSLSDFGW